MCFVLCQCACDVLMNAATRCRPLATAQYKRAQAATSSHSAAVGQLTRTLLDVCASPPARRDAPSHSAGRQGHVTDAASIALLHSHQCRRKEEGPHFTTSPPGGAGWPEETVACCVRTPCSLHGSRIPTARGVSEQPRGAAFCRTRTMAIKLVFTLGKWAVRLPTCFRSCHLPHHL